MSTLRTFEHLLPEDLVDAAAADDAGDRMRDSLADLAPVPAYQHRPVTREQLQASIDAARGIVYCGKQLA
jgi:hypothetical protein